MAVSPDNATKNSCQTNQNRTDRFSLSCETRNKKSLKIGDFLIRNDFLSDGHSFSTKMCNSRKNFIDSITEKG